MVVKNLAAICWAVKHLGRPRYKASSSDYSAEDTLQLITCMFGEGMKARYIVAKPGKRRDHKSALNGFDL